jgi:hypothetical protein
VSGAMVLQWEVVSGATEYHVLVSQNSDMSDPVIGDVTTKANDAPCGKNQRQKIKPFYIVLQFRWFK